MISEKQKQQLDRIRALPQAKRARQKNAAIVGRDNVESGELLRIGNLPQSKEAQHTNGVTQGQKNIESGHWDKVRLKGPRIGAHVLWHVVRGVAPQKPCEFCENDEFCESRTARK